MSIRVGNKRASIVVTGADEDIWLGLLSDAERHMYDEMAEATENLFQSALSSWPQPGSPGYKSSRDKPGRVGRPSSELLSRETVLDIDRALIFSRITNSADYGRFIKGRALRGKSVFVELLRKPMRKRTKALVRAMTSRLVDGLNG